MWNDNDDHERLQDECERATRAACDLAHARLTGKDITNETVNWIIDHQREDAIRLAEEDANGKRERLKQKALSKLNQDEREVLGL
jgi:hypothetical protein